MLRISQLKLFYQHDKNALKKKAAKILGIPEKEMKSLEIVRQSIDARKRPEIYYVYTVDVKAVSKEKEKKIYKSCKNKNVSFVEPKSYHFPDGGTEVLRHRPVVVGSGPCGLFCAYFLAKHGYRPILLERGKKIEDRKKDVETFWREGTLNPESNVQFGEGGAGTFSDGKLNTLVKDNLGRGKEIFRIFVSHGAPKEILYSYKPHIGTDILEKVISNMRKSIAEMGGDIRFQHKMTDILYEKTADGEQLKGIRVEDLEGKKEYVIETDVAVLALGHSARDTFSMLKERGVPMEAKAFAVGVRVEHRQSLINQSQYGIEEDDRLGAAPYKLTATLENKKGVYSFCMCPGGYVVNASSEDGYLAVNGMSFHARDGENANSAIVVTISPDEYQKQEGDPLAGVWFQRELERRAYLAGNGKIPVQTFGDFKKGEKSTSFGSVHPNMKGDYAFANVRGIFPENISESIEQGMEIFGTKIHGFSNEDTLLSAVESRTSSPVRITRNKDMECQVCGIYPCGEGAGYAGGITSAAMDGIKAAEKIAQKYRKFDLQEVSSEKINS